MSELDKKTDRLLAQLRDGDEDGRHRAWQELRQELKAAPARVAPRLAAVVGELAEAEESGSILGPVLLGLELCTRAEPQLVPGEVLEAVTGRAERVGPHALLAAAAMIARQEPAGLLTEGLPAVLETSAAVLEAGAQGSDEVVEHLERLVRGLWREVADRDPSLLADVLSAWTRTGGAGSRVANLFCELLVAAAPEHPELATDLPALLQQAGAAAEQVAAVEQVGVVERLVAALDPGRFRIVPAAAPAAPQGAADAAVDRDLELFCDPDPERSALGWSGIVEQDGSAALVDGLAEVVGELLAGAPADRRIGLALFALESKTEERPDLVPAEPLDRWLVAGLPGDHETLVALCVLARARPDRLADRHLRTALRLSMAGGAYAEKLWHGVAVAAPGLLVETARAVFADGLFESALGAVLAKAFEPAAVARPRELDGLIALLREEVNRHPESAPEAGMIRLGPRPTAGRYLERLEALAREDGQ